MSLPNEPCSSRKSRITSLGRSHIVFGIAGLLAPAATFLLAVSGLHESLKIAGLVVIAALSLLACIYSYVEISRNSALSRGDRSEAVTEKLVALEEAQQIFGASLKTPDMFKLASSRVAEILPFAAGVLFLPDRESGNLVPAFAVGHDADLLSDAAMLAGPGIAAMSFLSGEIEIDPDLKVERSSFKCEALHGFRSAAAIPLFHENRVFAVFQIFTRDRFAAAASTLALMRTIGERISPLILGAMTLEKSLSNALTDQVTGLANERAFFMVLEYQLAECQRMRPERPLSVLSIDINEFTAANDSFGHAAGDRILRFTAETIREQLRKMDFLARSVNDEFLAILPTASEAVAFEVMERIRNAFAETPFLILEDQPVKVWLNFGWATFWHDGETAPQLLRAAQLRRQQAKTGESSRVLAFRKDYVN